MTVIRLACYLNEYTHISKNKSTNEKYITESIRMSLINDVPSYKLLVMVYNL